MSEIELKIEEMPQAYVCKGVAVVDPKIIEDNAGEIEDAAEDTEKKFLRSKNQIMKSIQCMINDL